MTNNPHISVFKSDIRLLNSPTGGRVSHIRRMVFDLSEFQQMKWRNKSSYLSSALIPDQKKPKRSDKVLLVSQGGTVSEQKSKSSSERKQQEETWAWSESRWSLKLQFDWKVHVHRDLGVRGTYRCWQWFQMFERHKHHTQRNVQTKPVNLNTIKQQWHKNPSVIFFKKWYKLSLCSVLFDVIKFLFMPSVQYNFYLKKYGNLQQFDTYDVFKLTKVPAVTAITISSKNILDYNNCS